MRAVFTAAYAGVCKRKLQIIVFAAGCFLCACLLLGVFVLKFAVDTSFDAAYGKLDAPDMCAGILEADASKDALEQFLRRLPYVKDYQISRCCLASDVRLSGSGMAFAFLGTADDVQPLAGNAAVNRACGAAVGDMVSLSVNGREITLEIEAVVEDAVNSAPESKVPYFWVRGDVFEELTDGLGNVDCRIGIQTVEFGGVQKAESESMQTVESGGIQEVESGSTQAAESGRMGTTEPDRMGTVESGGMPQRFALDYEDYFGCPFDGELTAYEDIRNSYLFRYRLSGTFILPVSLLLFAVMLAMAALLSRMAVWSDKRKIAILQSIGFTDRQIRTAYLLPYLAAAAVAGGLGAAVSGAVLCAWLNGMFADVDGAAFSIPGLWQYQAMVLFIIQAAVCLSVLPALGRISAFQPVDAICTEEKKRKRVPGALRLPRQRLPQLGLAFLKCMHRRLESAFIFALAFGTALLYLSSFYVMDGIRDAGAHLKDWGIVEMDVYVSRKTGADERESGLLAALDADPDVDFYYAALSDTVAYRLCGSSFTRSAAGEVYDRQIPEKLDYAFIEGRNPSAYQEAAVGINFARENGISIGSRLFVERHGKETEMEVVGIYPSFKQYGNSIRFLTDGIQAFFGGRADGYYSVVLAQGVDADTFAKKMSGAFADFGFFPVGRSTARSVHMLLPPAAVCIGLSMLVYLSVLLCLKKIMTADCKKELAVYRSIGFTKGKIKAVVRLRFLLPVLFGLSAAVPLSVYAVPVCLAPLAQGLGLAGMPVYPSVQLVSAALAGILACSWVCVL